MGQHAPKFRIDNAPLITVLAKVQFTPILKMANYIPDFQDVVRKNGFPTFRQKDVKQVQFAPNSPPQQLDQRFWQFVNPQNTEILSLAPDFLTLTVSDYSSFESFSTSLKSALDSIAAIIAPASFVFLGFRSVNVIEEPEKSPDGIWKMIVPGLRGVDHQTLGASHFHHNYRYWSETPEGTLIINGRYVHGRDAIPTDLRQEQLSMKKTFDSTRCVYVLELDHNTSNRSRSVPFEVSRIISELDRLHETTNTGFLSCVTEEALGMWDFHKIV